MQIKGIDVSEFQGKIDWNKVKAAGIKFAMLRAGFGRYDYQIDAYFKSNVKGAEAAGIPWGAYWYSYAKTEQEARQEAKVCLNVLKGYKPEYPIALDIEDSSQAGLSKKAITAISNAFCSEIQNAGYYACVYTFLAWANSKLDRTKLPYDFWLAQWSNQPTFSGKYGMWQYTDAGTVSGIVGRVDMNYAYKDYPKIIRESGLNGYKPTGTTETKPPDTKKSVSELADEVLAGKWDNGDERKNKLTAAGYDYDAVQAEVNKRLSGTKKTVDELAEEVIAGKWGNGVDRAHKIEEAGYDYAAVQNKVNEVMSAKVAAKKSNTEIAKEVIAGKWGNGTDRRKRLTDAGYDFSVIQDLVNRMM